MPPLVVPFFISHRGCPHRCIFCDQEKISGGSGVLPTEEEIVAQVERYAASSDGRPLEVAFYGGSFTSLERNDQQKMLEALQPLRKGGIVASVRVSARPDDTGPEAAAFLRQFGVSTVELGVQSLDDRVLELAERSHDAACVGRSVAALRQAGMKVGLQLMPGLPGEREGGARETLQRAIALAPDFVRIYPAVVLEGTALADLWRRGEYSPLTLDEAVSLCADLLSDCLAAGMPVIRLGLQPTEELSQAVLAGPYHPAFRQLVEGEMRLRLLLRMAEALPTGGSPWRVACSPGRISDTVGQKRANLAAVRNLRGIHIATVTGNPSLSDLDLVLTREGETVRGSLLSPHIIKE